MSRLLHPEYIRSIPAFGDRTVRWLERRVAETLTDNHPADDPPVSVVIRTYNEVITLKNLLKDLAAQQIPPAEIIIVDNESTDGTQEVARKYGAKIITIRKGEFTYASSMNMGMAAATNDAIFLTVGHALLSSSLTLHAGARHFKPGNKVAGAFYYNLPNKHASLAERVLGGLAPFKFNYAQPIPNIRLGVMGASGAMFSKSAWQTLGEFDERYETGGEDTVLARAMLDNGYDVICEPAIAVHHAHGETLWQFTKTQMRYYRIIKGNPQQLNQDILAQRQSRLKDQQ